jgi:hypothetical protein
MTGKPSIEPVLDILPTNKARFSNEPISSSPCAFPGPVDQTRITGELNKNWQAGFPA